MKLMLMIGKIIQIIQVIMKMILLLLTFGK